MNLICRIFCFTKFSCSFQCQPSWTHLQCVISRGKDPLPAEVRIKCSLDHPEAFFLLDKENWYHNEMTRKVYADPVQESVRRILGRSVVRTFALFKYEKHPLLDVHCPMFSCQHKQKITDMIDIVEAEFVHHQNTLQGIIDNLRGRGKVEEAVWCEKNMKTLVDNYSRMSSAFLAWQILDTTHTFRVNKNWNSHGGQLGACLWASFENAAKKPFVSNHFGEVIPRGCVQTGAKHGNHDVTYVEYMCAAVERRMIIGGQESYLNHVKFRTQNHAKKVRKTFDEQIPDLNAPIPCPTRAHTMDFNCSSDRWGVQRLCPR